jgi:xylose isomerase
MASKSPAKSSHSRAQFTKWFAAIPEIKYEGPASDNALSYRYYNADEVIAGRKMRDWLRFGICYWHTFRGVAQDMFGPGTINRPWEDGSNSLSQALSRTEVVFDFISKLGLDFYTFHDRDVSPEGANVAETNKNLWAVAKRLKELQDASGIKLLWGTANMFSHPRFAQGAASSPSADTLAYCANSVKEMLDVSKFLGGESYVFWGGREGYNSLLNTNLKRETDHMARFFHMAVDYAKKISYKAQFLIEPKACEPTKHQYDFDAATSLCFLRGAGLDKHFKFNIEANHATLAGHDFVHELEVCVSNGVLGSVDANRGDVMNGWDTDQYPIDIRESAHALLVIMRNGGLGAGGFNFDAKVRRDSHELEDMFHGHISGIDTLARGLRIAAKILADGKIDAFLKERYSSYDKGIGKTIEDGKATFESLQKYILEKGDAAPLKSARQEYLENLFNSYC